MKRVNNLYEKLISGDNLALAIYEVNSTHKWRPHHHANPTVVWVENNKKFCIQALREMIENGFEPSPTIMKRRWDKSAGKWRDIYEPKLWPDQYIHHALIQVLQPVMMRGMDPYCCGSIRKRGIHYGMTAMKKWMKEDLEGTRYCAELDIHHYYDSLKPEVVYARMKQLVKDYKVLDLIWRVIKQGILIGAFYSQWFANVMLQPLDHLIREGGYGVTHYMRYMDNFTIFSNSKESLREIVKVIRAWLNSKDLDLKSNWQYYPTSARMPTALGYRYGHGFTFLRKRNLFRLKRQINSYKRKIECGKAIPVHLAFGLLSRIGQLVHCSSVKLYKQIIPFKLQRNLKIIIRNYARKERLKWNTSMVTCNAMA